MQVDHRLLRRLNRRSLAQQAEVRRATFSPEQVKRLRPFSIWEICSFMFDMAPDTLRRRLAEDPALPQGAVLSEDGRQRWFTLEEIETLRRACACAASG
jgi:hypothetical protein